MTDLFKLKKDGKTVGYLKMSSGFVFLKDNSRPHLDWQDYYYYRSTSCPVWDSQHPFVCKDKNGKDVWSDDDVLVRRDGFKSTRLKAIAGFENWVWLYWKDHSTYHWEIAYTGDIELIEGI